MLKKIGIDLLLGFLVILLVMIAEMLVTLPFSTGGEVEVTSSLLNLELVIAALPAFLITMFLAGRLKSVEFKDAMRRSLIWAGMLLLFYVVIGLGNGTFSSIFTGFGIYVLVICAFVGPLFWWRIKGRSR